MTNYNDFDEKSLENHKKIMVFLKSDIQSTKTKPPAGKLATEVRSGDAQKQQFSMKTDDKLKKSGNQPPVNHRSFSLFLSLFVLPPIVSVGSLERRADIGTG